VCNDDADELLEALTIPVTFDYQPIITNFLQAERLLQCATSQFTGEAPPAGINCIQLFGQFNVSVPSFK
jgi:hypothetical protein